MIIGERVNLPETNLQFAPENRPSHPNRKGNRIPTIHFQGRLLAVSFRGRVLHLLLGGGFKYFLFLPLPGEMIQFDEHIFQTGGKKPPPRLLITVTWVVGGKSNPYPLKAG